MNNVIKMFEDGTVEECCNFFKETHEHSCIECILSKHCCKPFFDNNKNTLIKNLKQFNNKHNPN